MIEWKKKTKYIVVKNMPHKKFQPGIAFQKKIQFEHFKVHSQSRIAFVNWRDFTKC